MDHGHERNTFTNMERAHGISALLFFFLLHCVIFLTCHFRLGFLLFGFPSWLWFDFGLHDGVLGLGGKTLARQGQGMVTEWSLEEESILFWEQVLAFALCERYGGAAF